VLPRLCYPPVPLARAIHLCSCRPQCCPCFFLALLNSYFSPLVLVVLVWSRCAELTPKLRSTLARANHGPGPAAAAAAAAQEQGRMRQPWVHPGPRGRGRVRRRGPCWAAWPTAWTWPASAATSGASAPFAGMGSPSGPAAQLLSANNLYGLRVRMASPLPLFFSRQECKLRAPPA